jgi:hypothetical protein
MNIVINPFDKESIENAEKIVRHYKKDFNKKVNEFTRRLAEIGVQLAGDIYSVSDIDGEHEFSVYLQKTENGYSVIAEGRTIGFLEFGTGPPERNQEWRGNGLDYSPPPRGSYGKHQGLNRWGWWFKSQEYGVAMHSYGNPASEGMLTARNQMIEQAVQIAREVFQS